MRALPNARLVSFAADRSGAARRTEISGTAGKAATTSTDTESRSTSRARICRSAISASADQPTLPARQRDSGPKTSSASLLMGKARPGRSTYESAYVLYRQLRLEPLAISRKVLRTPALARGSSTKEARCATDAGTRESTYLSRARMDWARVKAFVRTPRGKLGIEVDARLTRPEETRSPS